MISKVAARIWSVGTVTGRIAERIRSRSNRSTREILRITLRSGNRKSVSRRRLARTRILRLVAVTRVETTIRPVPALSHDSRDPPYSQKKLNRANISSEKQLSWCLKESKAGRRVFNFLLFFFRLFAQYRMTNISRIGKQEPWAGIKKITRKGKRLRKRKARCSS